MRVVFCAALIGILLLAACQPIPRATGVPADFELVWGYGACMADWGRTEITITPVEVKRTHTQRGKEDNKRFKIDSSDVLRIYQAVLDARFFSLKENYADMSIRDGSCSFVSVTANGKEHMVSVSNTRVPAIDTLTTVVSDTLRNKE